jgi:pantetheine-phosphate adenylyltransferase
LPKAALFAGSFDPVTNGHLDIARRSAALFDRLVVGVGVRPARSVLFTTEERVEMFREAVRDIRNVEVTAYDGLTVEFARAVGASVLIRSMRVVTDFYEEFDMALMNRKMAPEIESVFLMSQLENLFISGSRIRELAGLNRDVSDLVPAHVAAALHKKLDGRIA